MPPNNSTIHTLCVHRTLTKINHILSHKIKLSKLKEISTLQIMFWDHKWIKQEIPYRKIYGKAPIIWKLNSTFINNPWIKKELSKQLERIYWTVWNENLICQNLWDVANTILRGSYIALNFYIKKGSQICNLKFHLKNYRKKSKVNPKHAEGRKLYR